MRLEHDFENTFDKFYYKSKNIEAMTGYKVSQSTKNFVDSMTESTYGESFTSVKAETKQLNAVAVKSIVILYKKLKMSVEEIATELELEPEFITKTLKAKRLIK